jgi:hypothetical protein
LVEAARVAAEAQAAVARALAALEASRAVDWDAVAAAARSRGETRILKWLQLAASRSNQAQPRRAERGVQ